MGLGDFVEVITKYTGIKWVTAQFKEDCGCKKRQKRLNAWGKRTYKKIFR